MLGIDSPPTIEEERYWQGVVDGIATSTAPKTSERKKAMELVSSGAHVCYSSIIGPYCVICHCGFEPPYASHWSVLHAIR